MLVFERGNSANYCFTQKNNLREKFWSWGRKLPNGQFLISTLSEVFLHIQIDVLVLAGHEFAAVAAFCWW